MGAILGPLISSPRGAGYMSIPVMVLIAISGIFYPITALPEWLQWVAQVFPIYWLGLGMRSALLPRNTGQARGPRRAPQLAGVMIGGPHHDVTALLSGEGARGGQDGLRVRLRIYRQRRIVVCADDRHRGCHQQCRPRSATVAPAACPAKCRTASTAWRSAISRSAARSMALTIGSPARPDARRACRSRLAPTQTISLELPLAVRARSFQDLTA